MTTKFQELTKSTRSVGVLQVILLKAYAAEWGVDLQIFNGKQWIEWNGSHYSSNCLLPAAGWPHVSNTKLRKCGHVMGSTETHTHTHRQVVLNCSFCQTVQFNKDRRGQSCEKLRSRFCHASWSSPASLRCWWKTWCPDRSRSAGVFPRSGRR